MISGFATVYGAMQAALPAGRAGTASTVQQNAAQIQAFARAAASGRYPNLAVALAAAGPPRSQDDIFGPASSASSILRARRCNNPGRARHPSGRRRHADRYRHPGDGGRR